MRRAALFLDRDGVINIDNDYVGKQKDFVFVDGIFELCRNAKRLRFLICVVTYQAGYSRGFYSENDFLRLTDWMCNIFHENGSKIDKVYYCLSHPDHGVGEYKIESRFRKPGPVMIFQAAQQLDIDLAESVLVVDKETDIQAGVAAGIGCNLLYCAMPLDALNLTAATAVISNLNQVMPFLVKA